MINIKKLDIEPYLEIGKRRKWWIIVPFICSMLLAALYVLVTPKTYKSSTLILVEAQRIPNSYVKSTITESLQSRLNTISQQVYSRTNLEKIIKEFNLDKPREKGKMEIWKEKLLSKLGFHVSKEMMSLSDLVNFVRTKIGVSLKGGKRAFEISFEWFEPKVTADVTNALASQFIEQNLKIREDMAMGTTQFLEAEVERLRVEMGKKEKQLGDFKRKFMGMLPRQLNSNITILNQLKEELNNLGNLISAAKQQEVMLEEGTNFGSTPAKRAFKDPRQKTLATMEKRLKELQGRYTPEHPDIIALKASIKALKKELQTDPETPSTKQSPVLMQLKVIKAQIRDYKKKMKKVQQDIATYKKRIENTPRVALQLEKMEKEYKVISKRYQDLMAKKLNAQMAEELEKRQKGEQFRVIDSAVPALVPFFPNVKKVSVVAIILGLVAGLGMAFLRESMDPAFYTPAEVEDFLGTEVVVCLPYEKDKSK